MDSASEFIVVGVQPVIFGKKFRGFKYKVIFPDRTSKWIVKEDYRNFDSQPMIEEVRNAIDVNIRSLWRAAIMSHFVEYCKSCRRVMSQCRCPSKDKQIRWGLCNSCKEDQKATQDIPTQPTPTPPGRGYEL